MEEQQIYSYRLLRARRVVMNAFQAASEQVSLEAILLVPSEVEVMTNACCSLHNFFGGKQPPKPRRRGKQSSQLFLGKTMMKVVLRSGPQSGHAWATGQQACWRYSEKEGPDTCTLIISTIIMRATHNVNTIWLMYASNAFSFIKI